jgi:hypothetical protein
MINLRLTLPENSPNPILLFDLLIHTGMTGFRPGISDKADSPCTR